MLGLFEGACRQLEATNVVPRNTDNIVHAPRPARVVLRSQETVHKGGERGCKGMSCCHTTEAYIRDSSHALDKLQHYSWESSYLWLLLDMYSLCTSIPHKGGLHAVEHFLSEADYSHPSQAKNICRCTKFALERNYFQFNGLYYRQVVGKAMGAHFAPCYASLFMGFWKKYHIWSHNPFAKHLVYYG